VALLRSVAAINAVVCLYAIGQALALTAHERQRALSIVRATGGSRRQIARIFASGAIFLIAAALAVGFAAERELIARGVARIAAPYVTLALGVDLATTGYVALGLLAGALVAAAWISRVVTARPVVTGLRQD
jgi:ABC-type lipoprotein release transport system permease subunit